MYRTARHQLVNGLFINIEQVLSPAKWIESIFDELFIDSLYKMHRGQGKTISRDEVAEFWFNRPDINDISDNFPINLTLIRSLFYTLTSPPLTSIPRTPHALS